MLGIFAVLIGCSTKKDTFINRSSHAMVSKYNVLYNGNLAYDEAKGKLDAEYEDNFWEILPIEAINIEDKIPMPGESQTENPVKVGFDKAEEKAVKAIQKHSMVIDGYERNNQIDEAYLLLGKSRYFSQRFVPAREAFTYALEKYPNANLYYETKIWKAKTDIRLQNELLAIETLDKTIKSGNLDEELTEKAYTALAMAYNQLDSLQQTIDNLKLATYYFTDKNQGARNLFILGQLYREQEKIDSSNMMFEALTYLKKIPRKYMVHGQIERAKNFSEKDSTDALIFALRQLVDDRENRAYFDEIYYQAGLIAEKKGIKDKAKEYFALSILMNSNKPYQKSLSYEALGNWYFDNAEFATAGKYYDSLLQIPTVDLNSKRVRRIIAKNKSLEEVIFYENELKVSDSILYLASLNEAGQKQYFTDYVDALRKKDELMKIQQERMNATGNEFLGSSGGSRANEKFYFYNTPVVQMGKQDFKNRYGNRALTDNWIFSQLASGNVAQDISKVETVDLEQRYNPDYYIQTIPKGPETLDSISKVRNFAHYNLGLLYKEQFKEYEIAADHFEKFLSYQPEESYVLPAKYQLYKCYEQFSPNLGNKLAAEIVTNYSDSKYAQMISHPEEVISFENNESSPENIYKQAYICYEEGEFDYSLSLLNFLGSGAEMLTLEPKVELLKAFIALKKEGKDIYTKQLNDLIIQFPNTEESNYAKIILANMDEKK